MPVIDHPVNQKNIAGPLAGCHNRPSFAAGYWAPDRRYRDDGTWESCPVWVPHRMSESCRYDQAIAPERCAGCRHLGSGEEYVKEVSRAAAA